MAGTLRLEILTPEKKVLDEGVESVILPGYLGYLGVLRNHASLMTPVEPGVLTYRRPGSAEKYLFVSDGFLEVRANHALVLASAAERSEDIDAARAQAARERAEKRLHQRGREVDVERAKEALSRARARLATLERAGA